MSDANDNETRPGGRAPLTLKPRGGAVSSGTVKQSFSHGRSKSVVVETKRRGVGEAPDTRAAAPAPGGVRRQGAPRAPGAGAPPAARTRSGLQLRSSKPVARRAARPSTGAR